MRPAEVQIGQITEVDLKPSEASFNTQLKEGDNASLRWFADTNEVFLSINGQTWIVIGNDERNQMLLVDLVSQGLARLCYVGGVIPKGQDTRRIILTLRSFEQSYSLSGEANTLSVGISDRIFDELRTRIIRKPRLSHEEIIGWLKERIIVDDGNKQYFIITAGATTQFDNTIANFRAYGKNVAIDISRTKDSLRIERVIRSWKPNLDRPVLLINGVLDFADISVVSHIINTGMTELDTIVKQSAGSYLSIWNEYNSLERQILVDRAKNFGWIHYTDCIDNPVGWRLRVSGGERSRKLIDQLSNQEEIDLEVSQDLPSELKENDIEETNGDQPDTIFIQDEKAGIPVSCVSVDTERNTIDIRPLNPDEVNRPTKKGFVYVSVSGDRFRLRRREFAWNRMRYLKTQIPGLGFLLERSDKFLARDYKKQKISMKELRDAFGCEPTNRQAEALRIALNTSDIALIQGPPGTGKTKVISALNMILTEDQTSIKKGFGQTLLTSYQHDAVENVANRSQVFGLPALKIGRRKFQTYEFNTAEAWRKKLADELRNDPSRGLEKPALSILRKVQSLSRGYIKTPTSPDLTAQMLREVYADTYSYLIPSLREELLNLSRRIRQGSYQDTNDERLEIDLAIKAARSLRTDPISFCDDGPKTAHVLLKRIEDLGVLPPDKIILLKEASNWVYEEPPHFLDELEEIKLNVIELLSSPRVLDQAALINADVERLLTQVIDNLYAYLSNHPDNATEVVVARFIDDLENDPTGAYLTLQDYTMVLAATCQQSVGQSMQRLKLKGSKDEDLEFESVIVDEASRSNPLDLLIPMSLARRRIILVGDHRQLPHILEPDVERRLEQSSEITREILGKSLFERLFRHLQELQKQDGIHRTVTLDKQYRMHPVLGDFVSDTFYKPYGESFHSDHLRPEDFVHPLKKYKDKLAVWVNIPKSKGLEGGVQSKHRTAEARWIAYETKNILGQDENVSVGVITFYSAQVQKIMKEMERVNLTEEDSEGYLQIAKPWLEHDGKERLRVGTVDAFQGKEFDVVLLSVTRCNDIEVDEDDEIAHRRKYGFLTLENRLCVAMSRQKLLLMVVGDEQMILDKSAAKAVQGLTAFYQLCEGPYGLRIQT